MSDACEHLFLICFEEGAQPESIEQWIGPAGRCWIEAASSLHHSLQEEADRVHLDIFWEGFWASAGLDAPAWGGFVEDALSRFLFPSAGVVCPDRVEQILRYENSIFLPHLDLDYMDWEENETLRLPFLAPHLQTTSGVSLSQSGDEDDVEEAPIVYWAKAIMTEALKPGKELIRETFLQAVNDFFDGNEGPNETPNGVTQCPFCHKFAWTGSPEAAAAYDPHYFDFGYDDVPADLIPSNEFLEHLHKMRTAFQSCNKENSEDLAWEALCSVLDTAALDIAGAEILFDAIQEEDKTVAEGVYANFNPYVAGRTWYTDGGSGYGVYQDIDRTRKFHAMMNDLSSRVCTALKT